MFRRLVGAAREGELASDRDPSDASFGSRHRHRAQVPLPIAHTRWTARRVWRIVVLATQTPLTIVLPGPQPAATCVIREFCHGTEIRGILEKID